MVAKRKLFHILNQRARREDQEKEDREREMPEERSRDTESFLQALDLKLTKAFRPHQVFAIGVARILPQQLIIILGQLYSHTMSLWVMTHRDHQMRDILFATKPRARHVFLIRPLLHAYNS